MAREKKLWLIVALFSVAILHMQLGVRGVMNPKVPCLFIFGDSLSDSGNNNNLPTDAKVNYSPYGIDFPGGATGRFTNGRTAVDILTQRLGFKNFIPPFANTSGSDTLQGVNYASGSAGIRHETGTHLGTDISLELQLTHHRTIVSQISNRLGGVDKAQQHLNKCLYYMNIGSNDYMNNYFVPQHYPTSRTYNLEQYAKALIQQYSQQIKALHQTGARKFALIGLGFVGCAPHEIATHEKKGPSGCVDEENEAVLIFNDLLKSLVDQFNNELSDSKFIYVNNALIATNSTELAGLKNISTGCCQVGDNGQCIPNRTPCKDRKLYAFWDSFHPTEIINKVVAKRTYRASTPSYTHPMDIQTLVKL
ncbi:GDSL esterase/lipase At1g29660-like [Gastrolobium bilobum]|uniref:GDSL esterase/lipase At1g29660-like n=1 Tax=Gastrolobium bilobum TaxID=150636 RepID=UPI002AB2665E|nr:GDSL esterase/lipase At1g29660-like [Gastrolobium bilobum]